MAAPQPLARVEKMTEDERKSLHVTELTDEEVEAIMKSEVPEDKYILSLIENVDPNDTDALNEIDARVWCWFTDRPFETNFYYEEELGWCSNNKFFDRFAITRSRNLLQANRPQSAKFELLEDSAGMWWCKMIINCRKNGLVTIGAKYLPTEELAELHAIIQAIAYERTTERERQEVTN